MHRETCGDVAVILELPDLLHRAVFVDIVAHPRIACGKAVSIVSHGVLDFGKPFGVPRLKLNGRGTVKPSFRDRHAIVLDGEHIVAGLFPGRESGTVQNARYAVRVQRHICVPMAADLETGAYPLELAGHIEVVQHRCVLRIVVDKDRLFTWFEFFQPFHAFLRDQRRGHPHVRTAVAADETPPFALELVVLVTEHLEEGVAAALGPFGVMVSGHDIVLVPERIKHLLDSRDLLVGPEIRDVTSDQHEVQTVQSVDIRFPPSNAGQSETRI